MSLTVLVVDNYDSFAYNLVQYVGSVVTDGEVLVRRNDKITLDGIDDVDDFVRQVHQRCQFHGSVQRDNFRLLSGGSVVPARHVDELARHAETRSIRGCRGKPGSHQTTARDAEIHRLVQPLAAILEQHILAHNTDMGGTVTHVGTHIRTAQQDETNVLLVGVKNEFTTGFDRFEGRDTRPIQQRQGLLEDPAFGQCDYQIIA